MGYSGFEDYENNFSRFAFYYKFDSWLISKTVNLNISVSTRPKCPTECSWFWQFCQDKIYKVKVNKCKTRRQLFPYDIFGKIENINTEILITDWCVSECIRMHLFDPKIEKFPTLGEGHPLQHPPSNTSIPSLFHLILQNVALLKYFFHITLSLLLLHQVWYFLALLLTVFVSIYP